MLCTKKTSVLDFARALTNTLPFDASSALVSLENGDDPAVAAVRLGQLIGDVYSTQQRTIADLHTRVTFWQQHAISYRHSWETCQSAPVREHLHQAKEEIAILQESLANAEERIEQLSLRCNFLEHEKGRLTRLLEEHQAIVARQQVRLLELEGESV